MMSSLISQPRSSKPFRLESTCAANASWISISPRSFHATPVFTVPRALERAGVAWKDLGLIEIHEAFAAQVLSNLKGFEERGWEINEDIINVMGGSIAIGHPFGATGGRLVTTLANEMKRRDVQFGLVSVCAQGGMASAIVLERR